MPKFIGRAPELETLYEEYERDGGFVVIYGRRRVGKTTLIKEFIKDKKALYFLATEEIETNNIRDFANLIGSFIGDKTMKNANYRNWQDLFIRFAEHEPDKKKIMIIDELPYLIKVNPAFASILQKAWDEYLKNRNVMLILCGSLISMMQKAALNYDSPLYGRRTAQIRLLPLTFSEIYHANGNSFPIAVERYAITGGVPKYLELFEGEHPLRYHITRTILSKNGFLYEEPSFLLKEEVREPVNYFSIIRTIAAGNHKIGSIASLLELPPTRIMPYMKTLIDLGFVEKRLPITENNAEKSRKGLYFMSDNFMRFWFRYVYPFRGELELDNMEIVIERLDNDFIPGFTASAYEDICKDIFAQLCASKRIPFMPSKIGSWWRHDIRSGDKQIDVMAVDNINRLVFAGECKYSSKAVDAVVYFNLKSKIEDSADLKKVFDGYDFIYGVFSKSGFTKRMLDVARSNESLYLTNETELV